VVVGGTRGSLYNPREKNLEAPRPGRGGVTLRSESEQEGATFDRKLPIVARRGEGDSREGGRGAGLPSNWGGDGEELRRPNRLIVQLAARDS